MSWGFNVIVLTPKISRWQGDGIFQTLEWLKSLKIQIHMYVKNGFCKLENKQVHLDIMAPMSMYIRKMMQPHRKCVIKLPVILDTVRFSYQSFWTWSETFHPYALASLTAWPRRAAWCISFLGIHPTFTQVPPKPHVVPEYFMK